MYQKKHKDFASISRVWICKLHLSLWPLLNGLKNRAVLHGSTPEECWCAAVKVVQKETHRNQQNCNNDMQIVFFFSRLSSYLVKKKFH